MAARYVGGGLIAHSSSAIVSLPTCSPAWRSRSASNWLCLGAVGVIWRSPSHTSKAPNMVTRPGDATKVVITQLPVRGVLWLVRVRR